MSLHSLGPLLHYNAEVHLADAVAQRAHSGIVRWFTDEPYIEHPRRVADAVARMKLDADAVCAALMHDVVEDTTVTLADLSVMGFNSRVVHLVDLLSQRDDESYDDFIERVKTDTTATLIKRADMLDNIVTIPVGHGLLTKYINALPVLCERLTKGWADAH